MGDATGRKFAIVAVALIVLFLAVLAEGMAIVGLWARGEGKKLWPSFSVSGKDSSRSITQDLSSPHLPSPHDDDEAPFARDSDAWNPFEELRDMQERIDRMFNETFGRFRKSRHFGHLFREHAFAPRTNLEDCGDHYLVTVDLPGVENTRVDVKLEDNTLTISGEIASETKERKKGRVLYEERRTGKFFRSITLPSAVDGAKMSTRTEDGVLYVRIPKLVS